MRKKNFQSQVVQQLDFEGCTEGGVLQPLNEPDERTRRYFAGWETPLAPWGGFGLDSGFAVVRDDGRSVLELTLPRSERALVAGAEWMRDYRVAAEIKPIDATAPPHVDRADCSEALIGIAFRISTSRHHYHFGIEGRRRAVFYRRADDEWFVLAEQAVELPAGYLTLEVELDGDGIRCRCDEVGVEFFCTDTTFREGKAGIRGIGRARVASVRILQTEAQEKRNQRRRNLREREVCERGEEISAPALVRTFDLTALGGMPTFYDFVCAGRYDMLIAGKSLRAMTVEGELLWEIPYSVRNIVFSVGYAGSGRLIYGFAGVRTSEELLSVTGAAGKSVLSDELWLIRGTDGEILARTELPTLDDAVRFVDLSPTSGNLTDTGGFDILVREWRKDMGNGGTNLWAYDKDLKFLWHKAVSPSYGHHWAVQLHDMNGDGRDEILAGGTLLSAEGGVLWIHDLHEEMKRISGAGHYDAVTIGAFAEDESLDPIAFLVGGSAGVYVVDGLTGRTRMVHRVGHAQGRVVGKVRKDLPGEQVLVACRWGNMGILTLFAGSGDRLWTNQPDYIGQGSRPVRWGEDTFIWMNTSGAAQSFYDGYGRRVKELTELKRLWGNRMRRDVGTSVARMGDDTAEFLCLTVEGKMYVFGPG